MFIFFLSMIVWKYGRFDGCNCWWVFYLCGGVCCLFSCSVFFVFLGFVRRLMD